MKTFLKLSGFTLLGLIFILYVAFLFVLPRKLDLNAYKEMVQTIALEQAHLSVNFDNINLVTTPVLEAGINIKNINVKLPDGSELFSADNFRTKISLPNLFLLTVRVSEVAIDNPKINIEILGDGSQYKVLKVVEGIINEQKEKKEVAVSPQKTWFNPSWIKIKIPNIKVSNYALLINDLCSKHSLSLRGDELFVSYNHMKNVGVKTIARVFSDENVNITADIDINTFIPPSRELDNEDDPDYRADMSFVNPVLLYRDYDFKSDIATKVKARMKRSGRVSLRGYANIENITMNLSGYQLPKSYLRLKFKGNSSDVDTNLYVAPDRNITVSGNVNYGRHPKLDLNINTKKLYFDNIIVLTKSLMDTLNIKNDLAALKADGYFTINSHIKTNFKKIWSNGAIVVRNGAFTNNTIGLLLKDINANVRFNGKSVEIVDTHLFINDSVLKAEGTINEKSVADISLYAEKLPLPGLFAAFAPVDAKKSFDIKSGTLFLDAKVSGPLKKAISNIKVGLSDFDMVTKDLGLRIYDEKMNAEFVSNFKTISGDVLNNNLKIYLNPTKSLIVNPELHIVIDEKDLILNPLDVNINNSSVIKVAGEIADYMKKPLIKLTADGKLYSEDLKQILGHDIAKFFDASGMIPLKFALNGNSHRQDMVCQIKSDKLNYITPIDIESVKGLQSIIQSRITFKGDRLNIKDTGLYTKVEPTPFGDDFDENMLGASEVVSVSGTITKLDTSEPFINQIKVKIPSELNVHLCAFKDSVLKFGGDLLIFGQSIAPKFKGDFYVKDLMIPDLYLAMKNLNLKFATKTLIVTLQDLLLNGSDIQVTADASLEPADVIVVNNLNVLSSTFDVPRVMKVSEAMMKYLPKTEPSSVKSEPTDIPLMLKKGSIDFKNISSPPIVLKNTMGRISLKENVFYLNELFTSMLDGKITGEISANLIDMLLNVKVAGENFDVERTFFEVLNMKDTLSGMASFDTDLQIDVTATTPEEQMQGIKGAVNFEINEGQLGPFGRLENLILAENIRESQFFQTALGGVINSITSIETSHFDKLTGRVELDDGIAKITPIASSGKVMCMHIAGDMNLLTNNADMKLRAKLGSQLANMLGPIAAVNPVNLVKATPGLNVAAAKMFSLFTEQITQEELEAIPDFREDEFGKMSTTNFQVVIRGDTTKPLTLIKSFKWLATSEDIAEAESFVSTLPPADAENPNATLEELLAAQAEAEKIANENILQKGVRKTKEFFVNFNSED